MPQIPRSLPISRRKGSERLSCLERRMEHLQMVVIPEKRAGVSYDVAESIALNWAIKSLVIYESLLVDAFQGDMDHLKVAIAQRRHVIDSGAMVFEEL